MEKDHELRREGLSRVSERTRLAGRVSSKEMLDTVESLRSQGKDTISLKGAPYWLPPDHVLEAAIKAVREPTTAPSIGFPELRRAIANRLEEEDGITVDPRSEILVTNGAMHALYVVFTTFLNPGDEVVMYTPGFLFSGLIKLAGAVPVCAETRQEDNWRWDAEAMEKVISPSTKMIIVNSPTNPTGYVAREDDLMAIAEIARKHDLLVVSDECYDKMVYEDARHIRFVSIREVQDRVITVCSFTKSYAMPAWRVGFIIASSDLTPYLRNILEWNLLACNHVAQRAAQAALEGSQGWVREIALRYRHSRDLILDGLKSAPGVSFAIPKGTPFLFLNTKGLGITGAEFSRVLMHNYGVATEPGTLFGSDSHARLMFGGPDEVVREAATRTSTAARELTEQGIRSYMEGGYNSGAAFSFPE